MISESDRRGYRPIEVEVTAGDRSALFLCHPDGRVYVRTPRGLVRLREEPLLSVVLDRAAALLDEAASEGTKPPALSEGDLR